MTVYKRGSNIQDEVADRLGNKSCLQVPLKCFKQLCCKERWNLPIPLPSPHGRTKLHLSQSNDSQTVIAGAVCKSQYTLASGFPDLELNPRTGLQPVTSH